TVNSLPPRRAMGFSCANAGVEKAKAKIKVKSSGQECPLHTGLFGRIIRPPCNAWFPGRVATGQSTHRHRSELSPARRNSTADIHSRSRDQRPCPHQSNP